MRMAPDEMAAMMGGEERPPTDNEAEMSYFTEFTTYFAYMLLIVVGHIRDFWGRTSGRTRWKTLLPSGKRGGTGMAPLFKSWENFYPRRLYDRIIDVFNRPICSSPSAWITVLSRATDPASKELAKTGETQRCLNLGSYNSLGFADDWMNTCGPAVLQEVENWPMERQTFRKTSSRWAPLSEEAAARLHSAHQSS